MFMFDLERLEWLATVERSHFWFQGRRALILGLLQQLRLKPSDLCVDAGCGSGLLVEELTQQGNLVYGLDQNRPLFGKERFVQGSIEDIPMATHTASLVFALDVLEHVDDRKALKEIHRILKPGGYLLLSVPSCPFLWSTRDVRAGHLRRYTKQLLQHSLQQAGFEKVLLRPYQCFLFPFFLLSRLLTPFFPRLQHAEDRIPPFNGLFTAIARFEAAVSTHISLPWGSSWIALYKTKPLT